MRTRSLLSLLLLALILLGCRFSGVRGSGDLEEVTRTFESFSALEISGAYEVNVLMGDEYKVHISADDNLIPLIKTNVKGSALRIYSKKDLRPREEIVITVTTKELESIVSSGASEITANDIDCSRFGVALSGAGGITLSGKTDILDIAMSGAGNIDSKNLIADDVNISVSGVGDAIVYVANILKAEVSGVGNIEYLGNPNKVSSNVSGVGSISKAKKEVDY
ncbi:MAG: DUF2807 domain-containing protein [Ignavibacteriae bacterium]|nr:DUF2807 domain-containing protein [Ignavibacteriota bacterium]NOG96520.1 DUF2807 domain-containing protein [Ignavibacteriota bacterium]